jgi:hypothetical protein
MLRRSETTNPPCATSAGRAGGKVAYVQDGVGETADLSYLPLRKESISNSALIEDLDGA